MQTVSSSSPGSSVKSPKPSIIVPGYDHIDWMGSIPLFLVHVAAIVGVFLVPFSWKWVALAIGSYYLRMFAITAGYHRYFSHKTYRLNRFWQFCMAFLGGTATQKGALWWAANHRHHHRHSDQPTDLHSPLHHGFFWAHMGWFLSKDYERTRDELIPELVKFKELRFLDKHHWLPPTIFGFALYLTLGWSGFVWGYLVSQVFLWHGTYTINSLSHVFGSQRYKTTDTSRNNWFLAVLTMGEGWHNNHHAYEWCARQGFFWWEFDPSYYIIRGLSHLGITSHILEPPLKDLEKRILPVAERRQSFSETSAILKAELRQTN